jgi:5-methylcytosine-specific restriction endonuclease McrA
MKDATSRVSRREKPPPVFGGCEQIAESIDNSMRLQTAIIACVSYYDGYSDALAEAEELGPNELFAFRSITNDPAFYNRRKTIHSRYIGIGGGQIARNNKRAILRGLDAVLTKAQWNKIVFAFGGQCVYCCSVPRILTIDHLVPICRGGGSEPFNVVPSCYDCNVKKGRKRPEKFISPQRLEEIRKVLVAANEGS